MRARWARLECRILGVLFVAAGIVALILGDEANRYHHLLHLGTGLVALYVGFGRPPGTARMFCRIFGVAYLVLGVLGLLLGHIEVGPLHLAFGDHMFHVVLGAVVLTGG
jgi:hypothetical protein